MNFSEFSRIGIVLAGMRRNDLFSIFFDVISMVVAMRLDVVVHKG
jgi:hypothetical protein